MSEVFIHDVIDIDHYDAHQIAQALPSEQLKTQAQLHQRQPISPILLDQFRWPAPIQRCHELGEATNHPPEVPVGRLIDCVHAGAADLVSVQDEMITVGLQRNGGFGFAG